VIAPKPPQTQGKIERYHRTMKNVIRLENYYNPNQLIRNLDEFIHHYNYHRYHESLDNVTPADVYYGKRKEILKKRSLCKVKTMKKRKLDYIKQSFETVT
jgi:transposase InsO family protein